ncbi:mannitol dehydrogenase [Lacticaseibacillus baoqingensis]|uniref:Mannitol dehydrogenase n=1 Tax=Lacticaseibacillus baoqingensis TaxID=2486013 RepID=A0ABW4EB94_9LACO|nr:mannitol dehydrogenase [Lacticaseibacillus baoqingensis]
MPEALIIGAGNIGRGVVGYLLRKANYQLSFFDIDYSRLEAIKRRGRYHIYIAEEPVRKVEIKDFEIVKPNSLVNKLADIQTIFCCVYEGAFASIASNIVAAMEQRIAQKNTNELNLMLCVNSIDAPQKMAKLIMAEIADNSTMQEYFTHYVGINQVMVLSAGLPLPEEYLVSGEDDVMITSDPHLEIDGESYKGQQPEIPSVRFVTNAEGRLKRKVYVGNMRHTMAGFIGASLKQQFIYQAQMKPEVRAHLMGAFNEAHSAIISEYSFEPAEDHTWVAYMNDKLNQKVEDKITRVIANPERKLAYEERFVAPARLCLKHSILPYEISLGIAYGIKYLQQRPEEQRTTEELLNDVCGLESKRDFIITQLVKNHLEEIERK